MFKLNLKKPLVVFDLETTGTHISQDRIIEIGMIKVQIDGSTESKRKLINPTIPISSEASMVHGIYDEDVKNEPTFKQVATNLNSFLHGCDLAGYNCQGFDIPVLMEEFLRVNIDFDISARKILDAQRLFHIMEKRNLTAAYKFFCNKNLDHAHSAMADTQATYEVLLAQVERYAGQDAIDPSGKKIVTIENEVNALHQLSISNKVDLAGRIIYKDGKETFNFGKHKGKEVKEVLQREPSFYDWMMRSDFALDTKRILTQIKLSLKKHN